MATSTRRSLAAALVGGAAVLLAGCAAQEEAEVVEVATAFEDPATGPAARCALLAPATLAAFESQESAPCQDAIGQLPAQGGEVESVEIWGGDAQVRTGGDTLFLTETGAGWRVAAALCRPRVEAPYDCEVEGP